MALDFIWWPLAALVVLPLLVRLLPSVRARGVQALRVPFLSAREASGGRKPSRTPMWLLLLLGAIWVLLILKFTKGSGWT